jgi:predicted  nucleic acid-binding Zn-ribbon protein
MAAEKSAQLRFPIIRKVEVRDYPMYPGSGAGLVHVFQPGVNAIVGINGLGKTTMLNLLLRMLVGPFDPRKADAQEPGAKLHQLTTLKRFDYFSARVNGDGRLSTATLDVSFGDTDIRIVRDLGPKLEIKELWEDGARIELADDKSFTYEDRFRELIADASGIQSQYDFDFVVRNLLFFLEDKVPLIWNPKGQFEILRILFLDEKLSKAAADAHDQVMQLDSQYRNLTWMVNKLRTEHSQALAAKQGAPEDAMTLAASRSALTASNAACDGLERDLVEVTAEVEKTRSELFADEQEVDDVARQLEMLEVAYLRKSFPNLPDRMELLLGSLLTTGECPACGKTNKAATQRIHSLLANTRCPCCESDLAGDQKVVSISKGDSNKIQGLEAQLKDLRTRIERARARVKLKEAELADTREAYYASQRTRADLRHRVRALEANQGPTTDEFTQLSHGLQQQEIQVATLKDERADAQDRYEKLLEKARRRISEVADGVVRAFKTYARNFLLEKSELSYDLSKRQVGEGGPLTSFPSFVLKMSSGAAPSGSIRESADQVSESQKEFVDLAFRMAILDVCSKQSGPGMLVIETPESSLDSLFIERAGELLREFAEGADWKKTNLVIATTNLNKENMLGHLLDLSASKVRSQRQQAEVSSRVLNLLEMAAPTKAYKDHQKLYDRAFRDALGFEPS